MVETTRRASSFDSRATSFGVVVQRWLSARPMLVWLTDAMLLALVLVFPFLMGGREAIGHRVLISLATGLGFVWCLHQAKTGGRLIFLRVEPLILAGLILVWLQTVSWSPETLGQLSAEYSRLLPSWHETQSVRSDHANPAAWSTPSFYPAETRHAFLMLMAYGLIAVVGAQRLKSETDCYNLLKLIAVSGVAMAVFAVLQFATSNDRFFWFYRHPHTGTREVLKGAFTNRNHFAQFLSLSIGPLLWWTLSGVADSTSSEDRPSGLRRQSQQRNSEFGRSMPRTVLLISATGAVLLAILLSLSRGGMISAGLAFLVCLAGFWKSGQVRTSLAWTMVALSGIAIGGLMIFGQDSVEERVSQLASGDADQIDRLNARRSIWKADIEAVRAFPMLGTGVGSHRFVYPIYMTDFANFMNVTFSHAESTYIHLALETGLVGLGLLAIGLLLVLVRLLRSLLTPQQPQRIAALAAILASLVGGTVHAGVDFIWYAPAIVVSTILLGIAGLRLCSGFSPERGLTIPRPVWLIAGVFCLLILCRSQPDLERRVAGERLWYQYLITEQDTACRFRESTASIQDVDDPDETLSLDLTTESVFDPMANGDAIALGAADANDADRCVTNSRATVLRDQIHLLMATLKVCPDHAEAHQHLALKCLRLFELLQTVNENRMSLQQIREVVVSSGFQSTREMYTFLKRAFGQTIRLVLLSDQHSRRSLSLCPLIGRPYELLVGTGFITDPHDGLHGRFIEQTLLLGRHSPKTRYVIGLTLLAEGRQTDALQQWAYAFHSSRDLRRDIARTLIARNSVDLILQQFDPSLEEMPEVLQAVHEQRRPSDLERLAFAVADKVEQQSASAVPESDLTDSERDQRLSLLMNTYRAAYEVNSTMTCERLLRLAMKCDPDAEPPRRALGLLLFEQKKYGEADTHFAWCSDQLPGDTRLDELRRECRRRATIQSRQVIPAAYQVP